jgi:hypothetical protein
MTMSLAMHKSMLKPDVLSNSANLKSYFKLILRMVHLKGCKIELFTWIF